MKKLICLLFCCLLFFPATAQWKWYDPMEAGFPVIQNQGFTQEIGNSYTRLPERAKGVVSEPVWNLVAGIRQDSPFISTVMPRRSKCATPLPVA